MSNRTAFLNLLLAVAVAPSTAWAEQPNRGAAQAPAAAPLSPAAEQSARAATQFTLEFYQRLAATKTGNLFCSGYSVYAVFLMAAEGAEREAAREMGQVFHFPPQAAREDARKPWDVTAVARAAGELQRAMQPPDASQTAALRTQLQKLEADWKKLKAQRASAQPQQDFELFKQERSLVGEINALRQRIDPYELRFANAVWSEQKFKLSPAYLAAIQQGAGAHAFECNFAAQPDDERQRINRWVADQTNQQIRDLLAPGSIDALTRLVLTNAVYFKGQWQEPFKTERTKDEPFHLADGSTRPVPLMNNWLSHCRYVDLKPDGSLNDYVQKPAPAGSRFAFEWELPANPDGRQLLELPYQGGALSMLLILPGKADGIAALEAQLTAETLNGWIQKMQPNEVQVAIPRFKQRNTLNITSLMRGMGLEACFVPGGFTGMSDSPEARELAIGLVIQEAFVDVNEQGTEAAAATAIVMPTSAMPSAPKPPLVFRADRPFLFLVRHNASGAILFLGRMAQPE